MWAWHPIYSMCVNRHGYLLCVGMYRVYHLGLVLLHHKKANVKVLVLIKLIGFHRVCIIHIRLVEIVTSAAELFMSVLSQVL